MDKNSSTITLKKKHLVIGLLLLLLVAAAGVTLALNWNGWFGDAASPVNKPDIDPGAADWSAPPSENKGGVSAGIAIPGYPSIALPADKTDVQVALVNPEGNPCYFTFEIVLTDTGESLYKSKHVPPGKAVTDLTLTRGLPAGDYDAVIKITTSSLETLSPMNGAEVKTVLKVG